MMSDPFWFSDYSILYERPRLLEFFPTTGMSSDEKLNAIVRFGVYAGFLMYVYGGNINTLYLPVALAIVTKLMHDNMPAEGLTGAPWGGLSEKAPDMATASCTMPTVDNPFMNPSITDIRDDPKKAPACPIDSPATAKQVEDSFYNDLFRDVDDVWGRQTSSRNFYTVPNTKLPNDQTEFAEWLYGSKQQAGCREDPSRCIDDDLRRSRKPVNFEISAQRYGDMPVTPV